eukprot:1158158-Pelagomonas_calceolata.AAC.3
MLCVPLVCRETWRCENMWGKDMYLATLTHQQVDNLPPIVDSVSRTHALCRCSMSFAMLMFRAAGSSKQRPTEQPKLAGSHKKNQRRERQAITAGKSSNHKPTERVQGKRPGTQWKSHAAICLQRVIAVPSHPWFLTTDLSVALNAAEGNRDHGP